MPHALYKEWIFYICRRFRRHICTPEEIGGQNMKNPQQHCFRALLAKIRACSRMHKHRISSEPDHDASKLNGSKEAGSKLIVASGNTPILFQFLKETLCQMTLLVEEAVVFPGMFIVGLRRDAVRGACLSDKIPDGFGAVCFVCRNCRSFQRCVGQSCFHLCGIMQIAS